MGIKKMMTAAALIAMTLVSGAATVSAANTTEGTTNLTLFVENDPEYTITVPEKVEISPSEDTQVQISASDVKYIPEGKKISVTLEKGNGTRGRLYLTGTNEETGKNYTMTLYVKGTDGEFKMGALENQIKGMELASFTQDGSMNYELRPASLVYPDSTSANLTIQKGVHYSGYIVYGIELTDI